jgi:hypothetical protein
MKIAVIMSGIIKRYKHLDDLNLIFGNNTTHEFKTFGTCFDFLGNPRKARDNHNFGADEMVDREIVSKYYTDIEYVTGKDFVPYDAEGFSNRIISQWTNIKSGLLLAEKYETDNNFKFDMIIRARPDISIVETMLLDIIEKSAVDKKIYWRNDCVVVGIADRMKQILRLSDHYYEYHELPVFKQKTNEWVAKNVKGNRVRSNAESERLLDYHIINLFGRDGQCKYHKQFNKILRS